MALFAMKKKELIQREIPTLISKGCSIKGDMNAIAIVRLDGSISGDVSIEDGLIVGEEGTVEGNIRTKELVIFGSVNGNITAEHVEIKSSGKVRGEISTRSLVVEDGAQYNGAMRMDSGAAKSVNLIAETKKEPEYYPVE